MSIFLLILKIIGIVLLSILLLVLFLLCLVLFVPVRYRIEGKKELDDSKFFVCVKITYLLHIINAYVKYYEKLEYAARVFIFKIVSSDKKERKQTSKDDSKPDVDDNSSQDTDVDKDTSCGTDQVSPREDNEYVESDFTNTEGVDFTFDRNEEVIEEPELSNTESDNSEDVNIEKETQSIADRITDWIDKITDSILGISDKFTPLVEKVNDIKDNADYYINAFNDENNKEAIRLCLNSLLKILKSIRPRKIKGYIHIGKEDPYALGKILSIYSMIYPLTHGKIKLESEFDEELLEGNLFIKGKVTVIILVIAGIRIYFNKNVRNLIKVLKRKEG